MKLITLVDLLIFFNRIYVNLRNLNLRKSLFETKRKKNLCKSYYLRKNIVQNFCKDSCVSNFIRKRFLRKIFEHIFFSYVIFLRYPARDV